MTLDIRRVRPFQRGEVEQELFAHAGGRRNWRAAHVIEGVDLVLRRLRGHLIIHTVLRIQPLVRGDLAARGQGDQKTRGYVSLCHSDLAGENPVNVYVDGWIVRLLADEDIHCPRKTGNFALDLSGDSEVLVEVGAGNLNIYRRRQAEIENLTGDVRSLKEYGLVGELLCQDVAQSPGVVEGRLVIR